MGIKVFKCPKCEATKRTLKKTAPICEDHSESISMEEVFTAPKAKFLEKTDSFKGKSKQKNLDKILKERAASYARDFESDELIQKNKDNKLLKKSNLLNKDGKRRRKIDDI